MDIELIKAYADVEMLQSLFLPIPDEKVRLVNRLEKQFLEEDLKPFVTELLRQYLKGFKSNIEIHISFDAASGKLSVISNSDSPLKSKSERKVLSSPRIIAVDNSYSDDGSHPALHLKTKRLKASGHYTGEEFIVHKGSQVVNYVFQSGRNSAQRNQILHNNAKLEGDVWVTTADLRFSSPSAAAVFCLGRSANGWTEWVDQFLRPLKDIAQKR